MAHVPLLMLAPEDRAALERKRWQAHAQRLQRAGSALPGAPQRCGYCLAALTNGSAFCDDDCREGHFQITMIWPADQPPYDGLGQLARVGQHRPGLRQRCEAKPDFFSHQRSSPAISPLATLGLARDITDDQRLLFLNLYEDGELVAQPLLDSEEALDLAHEILMHAVALKRCQNAKPKLEVVEDG